MSNKKAVVFGTGAFAEVVQFYLSHDSEYEVAGFTATSNAISCEAMQGLPVVPYEQVESVFPPADYDMFIAVGYAKFNSVRERFFRDAKSKGYSLLSYICSKATVWVDEIRMGENVFIFEDNTVQPFVTIGDGVILWSGNHIGHHSKIGDFCFVSSHVVMSGHCDIGSYSFLGVNATIADGVKIGKRNLIGPGALMQKGSGDDEAWFAERAKKSPKGSGRFFQ